MSWGWLTGGGAVLVLGVLAALNPAAAVRLGSSAVGLVADKLRGALDWLRQKRTPVERWRLACLGLGTLCLLASFVAWDARRTIVVVRSKCQADAAAQQARYDDVAATADANAAAVTQCANRLNAEVGKRQEIERLADAAVARAAAKERRVELALADWQRRYGARPAQCDAALIEMERLCADVPNN